MQNVKKLIDMKQIMRAQSASVTPPPKSPITSSRTASIALKRSNSTKKVLMNKVPMDPALRISTPTSARPSIVISAMESDETSPEIKLENGMTISSSVYIEKFDTITKQISFRVNSGRPSSRASAKSFTQRADESEFSTEQIKQIADAENEINAQIEDLNELKSGKTPITTEVQTPVQSSRVRRAPMLSITQLEVCNIKPLFIVKKKKKSHPKAKQETQQTSGEMKVVERSVEPEAQSASEKEEHEEEESENKTPKKRIQLSVELSSPKFEIQKPETRLSFQQSSDSILLHESSQSYELIPVHAELKLQSEPNLFEKFSELVSPLNKSRESFTIKPELKRLDISDESGEFSISTQQTEEIATSAKTFRSQRSVQLVHSNEEVFDFFVPQKAEQKITRSMFMSLRGENEQIKTMQNEIGNFVKDLVARHKEIVEYLTQICVQVSKLKEAK